MGFADCDSSDGIDCETDLSTFDNCGRCGGSCEANQICEGFSCVPA
jgi:hypothetical protein